MRDLMLDGGLLFCPAVAGLAAGGAADTDAALTSVKVILVHWLALLVHMLQ